MLGHCMASGHKVQTVRDRSRTKKPPTPTLLLELCPVEKEGLAVVRFPKTGSGPVFYMPCLLAGSGIPGTG